MIVKKLIFFFILSISFFVSTSFANEADVIKVEIEKSSNNTYSFSVTVLHKDTGWEHYVNKWEVLDEMGRVLGTRVLQHPHVGEQPFTRTLSGIKIPDSVKAVTIQAHDSIHKYGGKALSIKLHD